MYKIINNHVHSSVCYRAFECSYGYPTGCWAPHSCPREEQCILFCLTHHTHPQKSKQNQNLELVLPHPECYNCCHTPRLLTLFSHPTAIDDQLVFNLSTKEADWISELKGQPGLHSQLQVRQGYMVKSIKTNYSLS